MTLEARRRVLKQYLEMKVCEEDWHGVSDAANDLRKIEARLEAIRELKPGVLE